jgi:hypothetical protein
MSTAFSFLISPYSLHHPHPSYMKRIVIIGLLLAIGWGFTFPALVRATDHHKQTATPDLFYGMMNEARRANNVGLLDWNDDLAAAAQAHADDIITRSDPSHTGSDGSLVTERERRICPIRIECVCRRTGPAGRRWKR